MEQMEEQVTLWAAEWIELDFHQLSPQWILRPSAFPWVEPHWSLLVFLSPALPLPLIASFYAAVYFSQTVKLNISQFGLSNLVKIVADRIVQVLVPYNAKYEMV